LPVSPTAPLSPRAFARIRELAYRHAGLELREGKQQLVAARLTALLKNAGARSFEDLCDQVGADPTGRAVSQMIDALTTNHTAFLREPEHFDFLRAELRRLWQTVPTVHIWSAACASGEEAYSIQFCAAVERGAACRVIRLLATDLSQRSLEAARTGRYSADRVRVLPRDWLTLFFVPCTDNGAHFYQVRPEIQSAIEFRRLNLVDSSPPGGGFQLVFCRNVMIYMDRAMQQRTVSMLASSLEPGGYLIVGHAESLSGISHQLAYVQPSIYRRPAKGGGMRQP
jgi:chemotaxis protein methyltransferase CheR